MTEELELKHYSGLLSALANALDTDLTDRVKDCFLTEKVRVMNRIGEFE